MKYEVFTTEQATADLRAIFEYIAYDLLAGQNALNQLDRLEQEQVDQLNLFMDALLPRLDSDTTPKALLALFEYLDQNDAICAALLGPNGDPAFVQRLQTVISERCLGYMAPDGGTARQHYLTSFAVQGCFGAIALWLQKNKPESVEQMAAITWQGIRAVQRQIAAED